MIRRREFVRLVGGAAAAWPLATRAQQLAIPTIGYLSGQSPELWASRLSAFREGLKQLGYVEGENILIEYRWAQGRNDLLPGLASDLAQRKVSAIVTAGGTPSAKAAQAATSTIPIIFLIGTDPIATGLVRSLNRPGANLTGVVDLSGELASKQLELLHEVVPAASKIAVLSNPTNPVGEEDFFQRIKPGADNLGIQLQSLSASSESDFDGAFATLRRLQASGLVIGPDPFFNGKAEQLAAMAIRYGTPAITAYREFAAVGGLMAYGPNLLEMHRQLGRDVGRILKGETPSDLPVQQATKIELTINLKTAKTLGITVPLPLLARADEVIE